jgi:hypothetical protein
VAGEADLMQIVATLHAVGRPAHALHRRQQQAEQYPDDGQNHEQFNQCKTGTARHAILQGRKQRASADSHRSIAAPVRAASRTLVPLVQIATVEAELHYALARIHRRCASNPSLRKPVSILHYHL